MNATTRALAVGLLALASCSSEPADLERNERLWSEKGPAAYSYTYATDGFLPPEKLRVFVRDHVVIGTTVLQQSLDTASTTGDTVEQLFDDIRNRIRSDAAVTAGYDPTLGFPVKVYSESGEEGDGWHVSDFLALD